KLRRQFLLPTHSILCASTTRVNSRKRRSVAAMAKICSSRDAAAFGRVAFRQVFLALPAERDDRRHGNMRRPLIVFFALATPIAARCAAASDDPMHAEKVSFGALGGAGGAAVATVVYR
ncbi:MAG: hypothetical protein ABI895_40695, partial [Deltaproteobacteria bacterium]